jgi:hypothetical protein
VSSAPAATPSPRRRLRRCARTQQHQAGAPSGHHN